MRQDAGAGSAPVRFLFTTIILNGEEPWPKARTGIRATAGRTRSDGRAATIPASSRPSLRATVLIATTGIETSGAARARPAPPPRATILRRNGGAATCAAIAARMTGRRVTAVMPVRGNRAPRVARVTATSASVEATPQTTSPLKTMAREGGPGTVRPDRAPTAPAAAAVILRLTATAAAGPIPVAIRAASSTALSTRCAVGSATKMRSKGVRKTIAGAAPAITRGRTNAFARTPTIT